MAREGGYACAYRRGLEAPLPLLLLILGSVFLLISTSFTISTPTSVGHGISNAGIRMRAPGAAEAQVGKPPSWNPSLASQRRPASRWTPNPLNLPSKRLGVADAERPSGPNSPGGSGSGEFVFRIPESLIVRGAEEGLFPSPYLAGEEVSLAPGAKATAGALAVVAAIVAFPGSQAFLPGFDGGFGSSGGSKQQMAGQGDGAPSALGFAPKNTTQKFEDPDSEYLPEQILSTWFGVGPSGAVTQGGVKDSKRRELLSSDNYIAEWKKRFAKVMSTENGRYQLARQMNSYQLALDKCLKGEYRTKKEWNGPFGLLAQLVLVDQFARGCGAKPLENQKTAEKLSEQICDRGYFSKYEMMEVEQAILPLLRSEDAKLQMKAHKALKRCAKRFKKQESHFEAMSAYAEGNAKAIRYFGRLPSLNAVLGRTSTREESAYLDVLSGVAERRQQQQMMERYRKEESSRNQRFYPDGVKLDPTSAQAAVSAR